MKKKGKFKRRYVLYLSILTACILLIEPTYAWLVSRDIVTNKQEGRELRIELLEPNWLESGQAEAQKLEPGMTIEKDPQVLNSCNDSVYVRMRIEILDESGAEIEDIEDKENGINRYRSILNALRLSASDDTEASEVSIYEVMFEGAKHPEFWYVPDDEAGQTAGSGWFYYVGDTTEIDTDSVKWTDHLAALGPGEITGELFSELRVPVYRLNALKEEEAAEDTEITSLEIYETVFDENFTIRVIAQGISSGIEKENAPEEFDNRYM